MSLRARLEALIAAVYLDGGMEVTRDFINRWILGEGARNGEGLDEEILGIVESVVGSAQTRPAFIGK